MRGFNTDGLSWRGSKGWTTGPGGWDHYKEDGIGGWDGGRAKGGSDGRRRGPWAQAGLGVALGRCRYLSRLGPCPWGGSASLSPPCSPAGKPTVVTRGPFPSAAPPPGVRQQSNAKRVMHHTQLGKRQYLGIREPPCILRPRQRAGATSACVGPDVATQRTRAWALRNTLLAPFSLSNPHPHPHPTEPITEQRHCTGQRL
jgi:hypothetical protein